LHVSTPFRFMPCATDIGDRAISPGFSGCHYMRDGALASVSLNKQS
jgi:hypothetical protein